MKSPLCASQQDYLKGKQFIFANKNNVRSMFYPTKLFPESISQINSDTGNFRIITKKSKKPIQPEPSFIAMTNVGLNFSTDFSFLFEELLTNSVDFYKKIVLFGVAEEIAKHIDDELKLKMSQDVYLGGVVVQSIIEVEKFLNKLGKRHELNAFVWRDMEDNNWEENVISIRIDYKDSKEKREIWKKITSIVEETEDKNIVVLTEVEKLANEL